MGLSIADHRPSIYLDLESDADRAKLAEPELYLSQHSDKLIILDEVHRLPNLFQNLRGLIDRGRRRGLAGGLLPGFLGAGGGMSTVVAGAIGGILFPLMQRYKKLDP